MKKRTITQDLLDRFSSGFTVRTQLMVLFGLLMIALTAAISLVIMNEIDASSQHQGDSIGQVLSAQTASAATDMLVTGDRLSLSALLGQLVQNPYVAGASIYSIDNQQIARATSTMARDDITYPVYSSPIHYQDVIAGYARLSLNQTLLSQKPREALLVIIAISALLLFIGMVLLHVYASGLTTRLRLIERQLHSVLPTGNSAPLQNRMVGEIARIATLVEQQLVAKKLAVLEQESGDQDALIVAIKVKNLARLQQLLAPRELQDILRTYSQIISKSASYYGGEVTYTPEGNAYLRFAAADGVAALFCCLMIEALTERAGAVNIASVHVGIGMSLSGHQPEFPEEQHPALGDSAASQALTLANLSGVDGIYVSRGQISWLSAELVESSDVDDEVIKINGVAGTQAEQLQRQIDEVSQLFNETCGILHP